MIHQIVLLVFLFLTSLYSAQIPDKVLICGIARNIESAVPTTIASATKLGSHFADYRVIIYENNSSDNTRKLLQHWADKNSKVQFISEKISKRRIVKEFAMKVMNRTEAIARARNIVLDVAMNKKYKDYKYVIWADLDFQESWDVDSIVETILHPQEEWDAVFAYGAYDLFALRSEEFPIGFELLGTAFFDQIEQMRSKFILGRNDPWKKVYSAFGGLGIYKRSALKGCRYSGVVTKDLETVTQMWLTHMNGLFYDDYLELLAHAPSIELKGDYLKKREKLPSQFGLKLPKGKVVWFSCTPNTTLPWTCEHVPFHASMILNGHDKLFINPKIRSSP